MGKKVFTRCPAWREKSLVDRQFPPPWAQSQLRKVAEKAPEQSAVLTLHHRLSVSPDGHSHSLSKFKQTENVLPGWEALLAPAKFLPAAKEFLGQLSMSRHENRVGIEKVTARQWASGAERVRPAQRQGHLPWSFLDWQFWVAHENLTNSPLWQGLEIRNGAFLIWKSLRQRMSIEYLTRLPRACWTQNTALSAPRWLSLWPMGQKGGALALAPWVWVLVLTHNLSAVRQN